MDYGIAAHITPEIEFFLSRPIEKRDIWTSWTKAVNEEMHLEMGARNAGPCFVNLLDADLLLPQEERQTSASLRSCGRCETITCAGGPRNPDAVQEAIARRKVVAFNPFCSGTCRFCVNPTESRLRHIMFVQD